MKWGHWNWLQTKSDKPRRIISKSQNKSFSLESEIQGPSKTYLKFPEDQTLMIYWLLDMNKPFQGPRPTPTPPIDGSLILSKVLQLSSDSLHTIS